MKILLTNDDGIHAPGIQALRRVLEQREDIEIYIVAPDRERSGSGHSITFNSPLRVEEVNYSKAHVKGFSVNGTPSDCVKLALKAILPVVPDLIISGINDGPNLGTDVLYSGTVSAAIEGIMLGVPAIAVSLASYGSRDYGYAARFSSRMLDKLSEKPLPARTLLNINIPMGAEAAICGLVITRLGVRQYEHVFDRRTDPFGRTYYWLAGELLDVEHDPIADIAVVKEGKVSVTPLHFDLTDYQIMDSLSSWEFEHLCWKRGNFHENEANP